MGDARLRLLIAALLAVTVVTIARHRRMLTTDGAIAAFAVGTLIAVAGGWWWGCLLGLFFLSSSLLSRRNQRGIGQAAVAVRGSRRDATQVLANGGVPAFIAALSALASSDPRSILFAAFAGGIAAANADTWATELGAGSRRPPHLLIGWRPVPVGTSGGVTWRGSVASLLGALLIAVVAAIGAGFGWAPGSAASLLVGGTIAGAAGSLADSLLGATLQAAYRCPLCGQPTERRSHCRGTPTMLERGLPIVTNDLVNLAAVLIGAISGGGISWLMTG